MELLKRIRQGVNRLYGYYFTRPVQRYNIENRAYKLIDRIEQDKIKPKAAPHEPVTQRILREIERDHPEVMEEIKSKSEELVTNVNKVRITSRDSFIEPERKDKSKLPVRTISVKMPQFGVVEPKNVTRGKITLSRVVKVIEGRGKEPDDWTNTKIAEKYDMDEKNVEAIFEHFRPFHLHTPNQEKTPWYNRRKLEMYIAGIILPSTWAQYRQEEMEKMEEAERRQAASKQVKADSITDGKNDVKTVDSK